MTKQVDNFDLNSTTNGGDNLRKFSDELLNKFMGKTIQIYIGDISETLNFDEISIPQNCCIFGKLIDVLDRFIIIDCFYIDQQTKTLKTGCEVYINTFQIRAMSEVNHKGSLNDIFLHINDIKTIRKLILNQK